jgi:hypothetical protein
MADWLASIVLQAMINFLYFCGMSGFVKDALLHRYFSQVGTGFRVKFETP